MPHPAKARGFSKIQPHTSPIAASSASVLAAHPSGYNLFKKEFIGCLADKVDSIGCRGITDPSLQLDMQLAIADSPGMARFFTNVAHDELVTRSAATQVPSESIVSSATSSALVCAQRCGHENTRNMIAAHGCGDPQVIVACDVEGVLT